MKLLPCLAALLFAGPWLLSAQTRPTPSAIPTGKGPALLIEVDDFGMGKPKQVSPRWQRVADKTTTGATVPLARP